MVVRAGVSDQLPVQLLLGRDVPQLFSLLANSLKSDSPKSVMTSQDLEQVQSDVVAMMMRAQAHSKNTVVDCLSDISEVNLSKPQVQQKAWSDKTAHSRQFNRRRRQRKRWRTFHVTRLERCRESQSLPLYTEECSEEKNWKPKQRGWRKAKS